MEAYKDKFVESQRIHNLKSNLENNLIKSRNDGNEPKMGDTKFLQAKRPGTKHPHTATQQTYQSNNSKNSRSTKRRISSELIEVPPEKKHCKSSPIANVSSGSFTRNLAQQRMQNLQSILNRRIEAGKQKNSFKNQSLDITSIPNTSNSSSKLAQKITEKCSFTKLNQVKNKYKDNLKSSFKHKSTPNNKYKSLIQEQLEPVKTTKVNEHYINPYDSKSKASWNYNQKEKANSNNSANKNVIVKMKTDLQKSPVSHRLSPVRSRSKNEKKSCSLLATSQTIVNQSIVSSASNTALEVSNKSNKDDDILEISLNPSDELLNESMDWSPINEEKILEDISEIRREINYNEQLLDPNFINKCDNHVPLSNGVFIIVDTNVFLSHLKFLSELRDMNITGLDSIVIVVPWMVIQELDYMKDGRSESKFLKSNARKAIDFIHDCLSKKHKRFKGQTVLEASRQNLSSNNADDGILFCCMQLVEESKIVVLLSNDKNLRNKALVNGINAFHQSEIVSKLKDLYKHSETSTLQPQTNLYSIAKIKILLSNMFTSIIEKEMENAYGTIWTKMTLMKPPFTVDEALKCLDKYWMAVFSFSLQKQCRQCIDEFSLFTKNLKHGDDLTISDFNKYIKFSLTLCVYFKNGYSAHRDNINRVIHGIQQCTE